jgi:uncharacterized metal-binding protein
MTVQDSAIARWIKTAEKVVLIDGCFLRCHGCIIETMINADKLVQFDALFLTRRMFRWKQKRQKKEQFWWRKQMC